MSHNNVFTLPEKDAFFTEANGTAVSLVLVTEKGWDHVKSLKEDFRNGLADAQGFTGAKGQTLIVPHSKTGAPGTVYVGVETLDDMWNVSTVASTLPAGDYRLMKVDDGAGHVLSEEQAYKMMVGWGLGKYKGLKIKDGGAITIPKGDAKLVVPSEAANRLSEAVSEIQSTWLVRDLIDMPPNILNTEELSQAVFDVAERSGVHTSFCKVSGAKLTKHYPLIDAVGRASSHKPNLNEFSWSGSKATKDSKRILITGKGIVFDSGGIQVKPGVSMAGMKGDMGGSAHALALAHMIMSNDLPVHMNVVIPVAENSINENAYRPSDVITAHDGTNVEIGHTDAEGRLILADALSYGCQTYNPDMVFNFATLTGAQRTADGRHVGGVFTHDVKKGRAIEDMGAAWQDDLQFHRMFGCSAKNLPSATADMSSRGATAEFGGATYAAAFLFHFMRAAKKADKFHFDINGGNVVPRPGRPKGGEAMGLRASYRYIKHNL